MCIATQEGGGRDRAEASWLLNDGRAPCLIKWPRLFGIESTFMGMAALYSPFGLGIGSPNI